MVASLFSLMEILGREVLSPLGGGYYRAQRRDHSCVWLAYKTPFSEIIENTMNYTLLDIPLLTNIMQLDSDLFQLSHGENTDYMSMVQFRRLYDKLGVRLNLQRNPQKPATSFLTIYKGPAGTLTLETYNMEKPLVCLLDAQGVTLQHMVGNIYERLHTLWEDMELILKFYRQDLPGCLGLSEISMKSLASLTSPVLNNCFKELTKGREEKENNNGVGKRKSRRKRGLLGFLFGNDGRLSNVESSLKQSVRSYNANMKKISKFDGQVMASFGKIDKDLMNLASAEKDLSHQITGLSHHIQSNAGKQTFYNMKLANLELVRNMAMSNKLDDNLQLLARGILGNALCTIKSCEKSIQAKIAAGGKVEIIRQILQLAPEIRFLIQCELNSDQMISSFHDEDGILQGKSLLINNHLIGINDLQNKTFINNKLKLVSSEQLLLGAFHHFRTDEGKTFLQCPNELEFTMDGKTIKCGILQKIPLQDNFKIEYAGSVLTAQHLQNTASKFKTWMSEFDFGNVQAFDRPEAVTPPTILHPFVDEILFTPLGRFRKGTTVGISIGGSLLALVVFLICYCKMACFKQLIDFLAGSLMNMIWNLLPPGYRVKYEDKKKEKKMERDLKKVKKLRSMIKNRRNLEQLQRKRRQKALKREESTAQEPNTESGVEVMPSAPAPDDIEVLDVVPDEAGTIEFSNGPTKTVTFRRNQS